MDGRLFLRIGDGVKSPGGFETNTRFEQTPAIPRFPKETRLLGKGNILALDGERKLAVQSRGVDHVRITLGRVPVSQFQHLVALTGYSSFDATEFLRLLLGKQHRAPLEQDRGRASHQRLGSHAVGHRYFGSSPLSEPDQLPGGRGVFFVSVEPVKETDAPDPRDDIYSRIEPAGDYGGWRRSPPDLV